MEFLLLIAAVPIFIGAWREIRRLGWLIAANLILFPAVLIQSGFEAGMGLWIILLAWSLWPRKRRAYNSGGTVINIEIEFERDEGQPHRDSS